MKKHRPYWLVKYDPIWPRQFAEKKKLILDVLGNEVLAIHHIGSTSIPGMVAKPQIDILVVVKDLRKVHEKATKMADWGFIPRGDYTGIGEEYFTEDDAEGERLTSVHILPEGHPEIKNILAFRDYLLENKKDRELYSAAKKELYRKYADNYPKYGAGKKTIITEICKRVKKCRSK
ncbi:MAG: GrpB family protein [Patescibacteria group bacterium]|nr:GrpB family protein [Patescibacteria group bacterium]MDD5490521.1 GrpB family protein [Patescibacteria group bacterium]